MLTRFIRIQLLIFTIIGIVGVIAMALFYIQAPMLLGIGRMTVTVELPATGGLYRFSNVTYRGVQIGRVTAVSLLSLIHILGGNRRGLTDVFHLLAPTTDLLNEYAPALACTLEGDAVLAKGPVLPEASIAISASLTFGTERYRYPANLPKVAATGGPHCMGLPHRPFNSTAKVLIADTGANPVVYGNPQLLLNFDGLKQLLYGPIDGPPRNPIQVGQQG